jgi:hypothetical protein
MGRAHSLVGSNLDGGRPADDFYPTPAGATKALLNVETFTGPIWEPACGDGAICKVLHEYGYKYVATDLYDHGISDGVDFLELTHNLGRDIVTNPPFKLTEKFILKCRELDVWKFALLGKLSLLEGQKRSRILESSGLARVWVFRNRLKLTRNGLPMKNGGMIAFAWFIFYSGYTGRPEIGWIESVD